MFLKKGLMEPSLIQKLGMKNSKASEEMFYNTNRYVLAEEATLDNIDVTSRCYCSSYSTSTVALQYLCSGGYRTNLIQ
jgi:hypothetical protein